MIEKVNPSHPDKVADRIAGAIVDLAYKKQENPKIAVEVLIGHGDCHVIAETSIRLGIFEIEEIVERIAGGSMTLRYREVAQDEHLSENQSKEIRCGDNGIFKGVPTNLEEEDLSRVVREIYKKQATDGKYIWDEGSKTFIACQSCTDDGIEASIEGLSRDILGAESIIINPLGRWTGGTDVDTGATNRKLGSDMGRAVTGGGLHGKDLSKADVAVNIYAHVKAKRTGEEVNLLCAIGDDTVDGKPYEEIVKVARDYIESLGGFEKLAEWGLV